MIILSARRTWITLRTLRSIQATPVLAQTMIMADIFMIIKDSFDINQLSGETKLVFTHAIAQDRFGGSVFWVRKLAALGGEQAVIEYWQIKRDGSQRVGWGEERTPTFSGRGLTLGFLPHPNLRTEIQNEW